MEVPHTRSSSVVVWKDKVVATSVMLSPSGVGDVGYTTGSRGLRPPPPSRLSSPTPGEFDDGVLPSYPRKPGSVTLWVKRKSVKNGTEGFSVTGRREGMRLRGDRIPDGILREQGVLVVEVPSQWRTRGVGRRE